jgi:hypothetical protein
VPDGADVVWAMAEQLSAAKHANVMQLTLVFNVNCPYILSVLSIFDVHTVGFFDVIFL